MAHLGSALCRGAVRGAARCESKSSARSATRYKSVKCRFIRAAFSGGGAATSPVGAVECDARVSTKLIFILNKWVNAFISLLLAYMLLRANDSLLLNGIVLLQNLIVMLTPVVSPFA